MVVESVKEEETQRQPTAENPFNGMLSLRYIKRKGPGFFFKGVLVFGLFVFFVQIATSHPKGGTRNEEILAAQQRNTIQRTERDDEEAIKHVDQPVGEQLMHPEPQRVMQNKVEDPIEDNIAPAAVGVPVQVTQPARKDRSKEFYENVVVHFDLKGAPPKVPYFLDLLRLIAKAGATGVLIEWEDMFPWTGTLEMVRSTDAYSLEDIRTILGEARKLGLDIIPLVQTFGHLEWFLKYQEFRKYRENDEFPQVLCLGDEDAVAIIKDALKQVVEVHKEFGIPFFHIGADEAFQFGVCEKSVAWISQHGQDGGKQLLALTHLKNIAQYVKGIAGEETTILAWHDMLKDFEGRLIKKLDLGSLVQPVVWDYSENIVTMNDWSFSSLAENFPMIWASSAFKGANFPSVMYIDIRHYETNNRAWISTKQNQERKFKKFGGIILTGWQRYDHLAGLCEILPMGTPSMILNIQVALAGASQDQNAIRSKAAKILGCGSFQVAGLNIVSNQCSFPGFSVYRQFQGTARTTMANVETELGQNHHIMGWLSPYSIKHNISEPWYLNEINGFLTNLHNQVDQVEKQLRSEMSKFFFENTIDEFLFLTMAPTTDKLRRMLKELKRLKQIRVYPKRNFKIIREEL